MSKAFKVISLSAINASGTSHRALCCALTTGMFFGQKAPLEIVADKGIHKPYFTVPLPEIDNQSVIIKKQLLLISSLQETAIALKKLSSKMHINAIEQLVVATSILTIDLNDDNPKLSEPNNKAQAHIDKYKREWEQSVKACVIDYLPTFTNKVIFKYS